MAQHARTQHDSFTQALKYAGAGLLSTVAVVGGVLLLSHIDTMNQPEIAIPQDIQAPLSDKAEPITFDATPADFDNVPQGEGLRAFALSANPDPLFGAEQLQELQSAYDAITAHGNAGFLFCNLETGKGISCNVDQPIYGASTFKGAYALYVCETKIEPGAIALEAVCPTSGSQGFRGNTEFATGSVADHIGASVVYSDNEAFGELRNAFDGEGFDEWALNLGAEDALYRPDSWFPWYSVRTSAQLWTEAYSYMNAGSETAQWLSSLNERTNTSFIREGVQDTGAAVRNKAGWSAEGAPEFWSVSDAGIISLDGVDYLMCIMTDMPDSLEARELVSNLARVAFNAREDLG